MTNLLAQAFAEAPNLPEEDQDALARWIIAELASERLFPAAFAASTDELARLADEALREHRAGRTRPLDPNTL